jgi:hypothetical protein
LDFRSELGAGTEVQLTVPASIAYEPPDAPSQVLGSWLDRESEPDSLGHGH